MLSRGEAERFKAGWHAALGVLALGCLVYNVAAWWVRRERRLARNAPGYAAAGAATPGGETMSEQTPADPNGPLMQAWLKYQNTADYLNALSWATNPAHTEGSLWAAFEQGFMRGGERVDRARSGGTDA